MIYITSIFLFLLSFSSLVQAQVTFTGDVTTDFSEIPNCFSDAEDAGIPVSSGVTATGFDLEQVCFFYDGSQDRLYVGASTYNDTVFGDADGDGNPSTSSHSGVSDFANLSSTESFVISFDLDADSQSGLFDDSTVDLLVGVSDTGSLTQLGAYRPSSSYDANDPAGGFGSAIGIATTLYAAPSASVHNLEFYIDDFSPLSFGFTTFAQHPIIQIFTGSTASTIGADYMPASGDSIDYSLYDLDEDGYLDWQELEAGTDPTSADSDNDGLDDNIEVNGANPTNPLVSDTDGDGLLDGAEDANQDGVFDTGESNPNDVDTDDDLIPDGTEANAQDPTDPSDSDSDDDGLLDGEEDANQNGVVDSGETDPHLADTDAGGVSDGVEIQSGFDPTDASDDSQAGQAAGASGTPSGSLAFDQVQGGGGCQLLSGRVEGNHFVLIGFFFVALFAARQFKVYRS